MADRSPQAPGAPDAPAVLDRVTERVRAVRALAGRSVRDRTGRFLVEGPQSVREATRFAPVRTVYLTEEAAARYPEVLATAADRRIAVQMATREVIEAMSRDAQGIVAVADVVSTDLAAVLERRPSLVAVLSAVRDPGNAGTVIRAADAAGADAVVLTTQSVDVHNPKVVRSTAGSLFHVPVVTGVELGDVVAALRAGGLTILAADGSGEHDLDDLQDQLDGRGRREPGTGPDLSAPTAWVFGNEAWGLTDDDRSSADAAVRVPLHGRAESLNLATAATVCLYASARARRLRERAQGRWSVDTSGPGPRDAVGP